MDQPNKIGAEVPVQEVMVSVGMHRGNAMAAHMNESWKLRVTQTPQKSCFHRCCGSNGSTSEYKISAAPFANAEGHQSNMYALEQYSGIQRCILCDDLGGCGQHAMTINVTSGTEKGGELIVKYTKPYSYIYTILRYKCCNPCCTPSLCKRIFFVLVGAALFQFSLSYSPTPADGLTLRLSSSLAFTFGWLSLFLSFSLLFFRPCCCLPKLTAVTSTGQKLGTSKYICDMCVMVPKFGYYEEDQMVYYIAPETACMGACPVRDGEGLPPFLFRDPTTKVPLGQGWGRPSIEKQGTKYEQRSQCPCGENTHNDVVVVFPEGITPERKAGLLGMAFLIDAVCFETRTSVTKSEPASHGATAAGHCGP